MLFFERRSRKGKKKGAPLSPDLLLTLNLIL